MELSIIIATYNNAKSLERTLNSVAKQDADYGAWECVIVNNNSTDDTALRVSAFAKAHSNLNIRLVDEPQQGLSYARNRGIAESQGEILAFIDDDETINEGFVSAYIDLFHNHGAFAAAGAVEVRYDSQRPKWMSYYTEKMIGNPINLGKEIVTITSAVTPAGGNMAFNREIFNLYGGFDTDLGRKGEKLFGGEENELFDRLRNLGERVFYTPKAIVYHHIADRKLTPEYFDKLSYGVGVSKLLRAEKQGTEQALYKDERAKRRYTLLLSLFYILTLRPQKAKWLMRMRNGISKGIFGN
ncbi:MAG: glycosyltransferase [Rikenellaceae bacterium]|nr:glycosyltransferase [Rikenellaceae bacterium]